MEKYNLTMEDLWNYMLYHSTEDFPITQSLDKFYKKVREWCDLNANYKQD